jgi:hypothetical protein
LLLAPHPSEYFDSDEKVEEMATFWRALWGSNSELSLGLTYGWMTACFYRPLAHAATSQFPLLHVVGSSGYGKTSTLRVASAMHTYLVDLPETTPNSSPFAFSQLVSCYTSSPVLLDEYKPGRMATERLEAFRSLLRDAYNQKAALRGGRQRLQQSLEPIRRGVAVGHQVMPQCPIDHPALAGILRHVPAEHIIDDIPQLGRKLPAMHLFPRSHAVIVAPVGISASPK